MKNNLLNNLTNLLKKDVRLNIEWELSKAKIQELAFKLDKDLIKLLINDKNIKEIFFQDIDWILIFNNEKFVKFINNKEFLPDSFTSFKNKIWLTDWNNFISNNSKVVLNWPYKDCILAWWQDKEDTKRDEIFYNDILARDDIDRLLDEKSFTNFKKIDENWENQLDNFKKDTDWNIKDNLLIKWNNLLALHSLKKNFAGKVKLIYIDPPYNTWNDSFNYNDRFNHSSWLTFMKNRLTIAKDLLKDDWVIFVQCDDNEQAYLKILMDEIFWIEKNINTISVKMSESKGLKNAHIEKRMPKNKEYILIYSKKENTFLFNPEKIEKNEIELKWYVKYYNKIISNIDEKIENWKIESYKEWNNVKDKLKYKNSLIYMVKPDNEIKIELKENKFWFIINSRWKKNIFYKNKWIILKVLILWENISKFLWDLWTDISTININKESWVETLSNWQKPEKLIERIINLSTNTWDIVLDYHLWSWTTCAVAHKMWRQYIWIEQMDYIETISKERLKKVIKWEQGWISKNLDWKGWWNFVYMEIADKNIEILNKINNSKNSNDLKKILENMEETGAINYKVKASNINENIEDYDKLNLEEQKQFLIELLDKNQLFLNYSEINDEKNNVSDNDKKLNKQFYS